ncbi:MAG: SgcJ/EcaC family oxidoreductase [Terracidiphilus sp.]
MKAIATLCGATLIALSMAACNQAPPAAPDTHDADVKAISDLEAQWSKDYAARDAGKIAAYYADDAVLMTPGSEATSGKDAIASSMKEVFAKDPAFSLQFKTSKVDVAKSGDVGYSWGTYQLTMSNPAGKGTVNDHGSYVTVYRKEADGSWKAVEDIATTAVPPPAPKHKI